MITLGLHGGVTLGQHEPAAALAVNGRIVALCEEERYLRIKSCYGMLPERAIHACLDQAGVKWEDINLVVTPGITYPDVADRWRSYLTHLFGSCPKLERVHHQAAHLNAAFYGSGMEESLCLSLDASGDAACGMTGEATRAGGIKVIEEIPTKNSLGYFYTLMTYYCGFADGDEYKLMGLAPYGKPTIDLTALIRPSREGWEFDWSYVRSDPPPKSPFEPLYSPKLEKLLGRPNRRSGEPLDDFYRDVAASTQQLMEDCLHSLVAALRRKRPEARHLCYAGGVALNCSANRGLLGDGFDHIHVSPVSSDRGLALGCAYAGAVMLGDQPWPLLDAYLGTDYPSAVAEKELKANSIRYRVVEDAAEEGAKLLEQKKIVGWHQGRAEAGARALGNRSILASCSDPGMRDLVNARIKYREEFRPFAPSVLQDRVGELFEVPKPGRAANGADTDFPYMTFTLKAREDKAADMQAVVHVDGTSRVQTVRSSSNERYYDLIRRYAERTGAPVIMNTSFNLKGQPIVETPRDALMTFFGCGLDALFIGNYLIEK
jgi:carbamoyltransferase